VRSAAIIVEDSSAFFEKSELKYAFLLMESRNGTQRERGRGKRRRYAVRAT
jgi:hypothetical protein